MLQSILDHNQHLNDVDNNIAPIIPNTRPK